MVLNGSGIVNGELESMYIEAAVADVKLLFHNLHRGIEGEL
jgi:hypothetical protein